MAGALAEAVLFDCETADPTAQPSEGPLRRLGGRILPLATVLRLTDMQFRCGECEP